uniref:Putative rte ele1 orf1-h 1e-60-j 4 n=1 Tax=Ixodes ricinus TaxID=34613 RepID=A0A0K8RKF5_IXORI
MTVDTVAKKTFDLLISSGGCTNVVTRPTRVTCQSQTLIDLFISNCSSECMKAGVIGCDLSDHLPIFIAVKSIPGGISKTQRTMIQKISPDQLDRFRSAAPNVNWSGVTAGKNNGPNGDVTIAFMELFVELYNRYFPFKSIKISKRIRKPWVTHDLLCKIRIKNSLFSQFAKSRATWMTSRRFKIYRNILNKRAKSVQENVITPMFSRQRQGRTDIMWRQLNSLLNRKRPSSSPEKIVNNGIELSGCSLANAFNEHFINCYGHCCIF